MSGQSAIEWTESTWNPTTGCDRISEECDHCYALDFASRLKRMGQPAYQADGDPRTSGPGFRLTLHPDRLEAPLKWRKPRTVFVDSMSDLFHKDVPYEFIASVFNIMARCPQHTFQVLTKRPKRMARIVTAYYHAAGQNMSRPIRPLPNVWLGTSIGTPKYTWRADHLRSAPAAVRFISAEPLLGPLISRTLCRHVEDCQANPGWDECVCAAEGGSGIIFGAEKWSLDLTGIDWLIVGGESGRHHRPTNPEWVRDLRDACWSVDNGRDDGIAFFFKQWGGLHPKSRGRLLDGRTWDEMPALERALELP